MSGEIYANNYEIQEDIAQGAMGMVRKALDLKLNRIVALKIVHQHLCSDETFRRRFLREARAMAQLQHANIVTIYAVEQHEGTQFIVMEYFPGGNLSSRMVPDTCLPLEEAIAITQQLASALAYAHDRAIIHRDIKPANVLINSDNLIKLTDFGIAAALDESPLTNAGQLIGTLRYMSPEQARDATLDGRSDLYSLGLMFYEMVTGSHPRRNQSNTAILSMLAAEANTPPLAFTAEIPQEVQQIIQDLVRFKPTDRIKDARTLVRRLESLNLGTAPSKLADSHQPSADATIFELGSQERLPPPPKQQMGQRQPNYKRLGATAALGATLLLGAYSLYKIVPPLEEFFKQGPVPDKIADGKTTIAPPSIVDPEPTNTGTGSTPSNMGNRGEKEILEANNTATELGGARMPSAIPLKPPPPIPTTAGPLGTKKIEAKQPLIPSSSARTDERPVPTPAKPPVVPETTPPKSDQEILQRLGRVRALVEKKDLTALAALTAMSKDQGENLQALFDNYATITASLGKITTTNTTLTTTLRIDKLITVDGESVPVEDMLRSMPITVPRNGDQWGPITW